MRTAPHNWWTFHAEGCGTEFRGCAPDCPKDIFEESGVWTGPAFPLGWKAARILPAPGSQGAFGAVRKHDIHTGVDLYCPEGTEVLAVEAGTVVAVVPFTGPEAESPWWNSTKAVLVESRTQVLCYGEIEPIVEVGAVVAAGQVLGRVVQVLKRDKGKPTSMLHFEAYTLGTREPPWWKHGDPKPENLVNPTSLLVALLEIP